MSVEGQAASREGERNSWISQSKAAGPGRGEGVEFTGPRAYGRLALLKPLARGGMGEVYLAALGDIEGAERPCVVKLIRQEHRDDASFVARFLDEARIQAQMQHPGVAQVLEAALDPDGRPYVVVEYVAGRDLAEIRQRAGQLKLQISWSDAVAIAASLAEALGHVHERTDPEGRPLEVVHRDLSPQNIMISYVGDTKLIDFGTARGENRRCQTISGIVFAKPGYVAPEVAANTPGGVAADLYALGIILWELIAGRRFLQGDTQEHLAAVAKGERTPPALSLWLAVPRELDTIISRLTATRIEDRFAAAREAHEQLVKLLQQAPGLANGERSVRGRIAHLMLRLYPAEPARSRAEFAHLVSALRKSGGIRPEWHGSPRPLAVEPRDSLLPGTRYRVLREIAKGPMSVVLEAQHVDLGRKVALKVLDRERCRSVEAEARFRHEARVVAQIRHENLVQIHDFGVSAEGRPYYAMEYLEGETLAQRLAARGRLPWREVVELGIQACRALEAAHALGIVHRDIKPANLFVTTSGNLKLLDFGITQTGVEPESTSTESLSLIGTPEYMAPEQIGRATVDARADVYALGAALYELLTGVLPHMGSNTVTLLDAKIHERVKAPSQRVRKLKLPRYLDRVLLTALAKETYDRYDNVTGLRQDLSWILGADERARVKRRRRVVVGMGVLGSGAALALVAAVGLGERLQVNVASLTAAPADSVAPATEAAADMKPAALLAANAAAPAESNAAIASMGAGAAAAPTEAAKEGEPLGSAPNNGGSALDPESATGTARAANTQAPPSVDPPSNAAPAAAENAEARHTPAPAERAAAAKEPPTKPASVAANTSATPASPDAHAKGESEAPSKSDAKSATPALAAAPAPATEAATKASPAVKGPPAAKTASATPSHSGAAASSAAPSRSGTGAGTRDSDSTDASESEPPKPAPPKRRGLSAPERAEAALAAAVADAEGLIGHHDVRALLAFRALGEQHPDHPKVLEGWSHAAAATKWWGECLRVAEHWAAVDHSSEAQINLARTQKRLGQLERAIETLKSVLARKPNDRDASTLLQAYGGAPLALR